LNYYDLIFDRVKKGGYIIADNVLWSGKILDAQEDMDADTKALYDYAHKVKADVRVETLLLPVRDGMMIARKIV
jgi:predicted O-methyltransferase YrrM